MRYDEVASGSIGHAIRVTVPRTQQAAVWPARHVASSRTDASLPPMGLRLRLKANVDISGYPPQLRAILTALKTYGLIVADNGSPWFMSGVPDEHWDNDMLHLLGQLHGSDFEVVDTSSLMVDPNSGQARSRLEALDDRAGAEPATAAHRHEAVAPAGALELVERLGEEDRTRAAERVAQGDGAAVRVHLLHVGVDLLRPREHDGGERLVDLERVDVVGGQARARRTGAAWRRSGR